MEPVEPLGREGPIKDLREKVKLEKRARQVALVLSKKGVSAAFMCEAAELIMGVHYQLAVEERAAKGLCGYPLCDNNVMTLTQKYRIDLSQKRVYDITELKNFCGQLCFASSMHFEAQISKLPLGLRTAATRPMPPVLANSPSSPGTVGDPKVRSSGDARSRLGRELIVKDEKGLKVQERSTTVQPKAPNASNPSTHLLIEGYDPKVNVDELREFVLSAKMNRSPTANDRIDVAADVVDSPTAARSSENTSESEMWKEFDAALSELEEEERSKLLIAVGKKYDRNRANIRQQHSKQQATITQPPAQQVQLSRKSPAEITRDLIKSWATFKTVDFLAGRRPGVDIAPVVPDTEVNSIPMELPLIDSRAQAQVRKKMFTTQLNRVLPTVLNDLDIPRALIDEELRALVDTFRLNSKNILLRPIDWIAASLLLLVLLSDRLDTVSSALNVPIASGGNRMARWLAHAGQEKLPFEELVAVFRGDNGPII